MTLKAIALRMLSVIAVIVLNVNCGTNLITDYTITVLPASVDLITGTLGDNNDDTTIDFPARIFVFDELEVPANNYEISISSPGAYGQRFSDGSDVDFVQFLQSDGTTVCNSPCTLSTDGEGKIDFFVRINHLDLVTDAAAFDVLVSHQTLASNITINLSFE